MAKSQSFAMSGRVYLLVAIAIFGAANAVTRKLTDLGAANLINGRNPISFCNVLFVGNLCALILLAIVYFRQWRGPALRQISPKDWLLMTLVAVLGAAVVPTLVFTALSITAVNNVILIGQVDTPLVLALSVLLLGERINRWVVAGALLSFVGVALTVLIPPPGAEMVSMGMMGLEIGKGELLVVVAAVFKAVANLISKLNLKQIPLGIFSVYRMLIGTLCFFGATMLLYGPAHFMDVGSPFLWQWMVGYAAIIVVGGQFFWFSGLKLSTASEVSFATAFNPIAGVLAAYLLLGDVPTVPQYLGGAVILLGIALNQVGVQRLNQVAPAQSPTAEEMNEAVGFKGVG
ncbi:MAG: DMT family transporter [Cyanobacteria bacterium P01_A01_bin.105]